MSDDPYSARVREYFDQPRHGGRLDGACAGYFNAQGLRIRLTATVADTLISAMRFQAWACPHVIAAAEALCRHYEGRRVSDLEKFSTPKIMQDLGIPVEKTGRILVLEDTVRSLRQAILDAANE